MSAEHPEQGPHATASGARLGPYKLLRLLGRGSMGSVHAACDLRSNKLVAIKLMSLAPDVQGTALDEASARFAAEARTAKRLAHPNIVRVLASGRSGRQFWLAMELLSGVPLSRYTQPDRLLPEALVLTVCARLAQALAHLHALGVVHRDVKPANVLVHWPSDSVKLTDFGLARDAHGSATQTGVLLGTPAYMAPEQLGGAQADTGGDTYALGVTLFQLLTGRLPHLATNMGELLQALATSPAPALSSLRPTLPDALGKLVSQLLAHQPQQRLADLPLLAQQLRSLAEQLTSAATAAASNTNTSASASGAMSR